MKNILLIEDNKDIREGIEEILTLEGYVVRSVDSGKTAIEFLSKQAPDLVLCDILMPDIDGYHIYEAFKQFDHSSSIPFIFMTAMSEKRHKDKAVSLGISHYLIKPFDDLELLHSISKFLKTSSDHLST